MVRAFTQLRTLPKGQEYSDHSMASGEASQTCASVSGGHSLRQPFGFAQGFGRTGRLCPPPLTLTYLA